MFMYFVNQWSVINLELTWKQSFLIIGIFDQTILDQMVQDTLASDHKAERQSFQALPGNGSGTPGWRSWIPDYPDCSGPGFFPGAPISVPPRTFSSTTLSSRRPTTSRTIGFIGNQSSFYTFCTIGFFVRNWQKFLFNTDLSKRRARVLIRRWRNWLKLNENVSLIKSRKFN